MKRINWLGICLMMGLLLTSCAADAAAPALPSLWGGPLGLVYQVLMAIAGFALLVAGYKIFENLLQFIGFLMGAMIGSILAGYLFSSILWQIVSFFVGGLAGMMLIESMLYLVVGGYGFAMGAALVGGPIARLMMLDVQFWGLMVGGIIGAVLLIVLFRVWVSAFTAAVGAGLIVLVLSLDPAYWFVLLFAGLVIQYLQKDND
ncbi:MAG: hypothetical protein JW750_02750 [Anaerolineaceae bacterium]|nr:hypothetical protein [Anaerolineaceae bacterium]